MRDAGCREAILWAVEGNERAAAFYEPAGGATTAVVAPASTPDAREVVEVRFRRALAP
jgi:hypothetical protein